MLTELAKTHIQAVLAFQRFFKWKSLEVTEAKIDFMEEQGRWFHHIGGQPLNTDMIKELCADLEAVKAARKKPTPAGA